MLGSSAASVTFSSIPSTYKDLVLEVVGTTSANGNALIQFNSDSGANYSSTTVRGDGSSASSVRTSDARLTTLGIGTGTFTITSNIQSYANANVYKTWIARYGDAAQVVGAVVGLWRSTTAISTVTATFSGGNYATGTSFRLWGIA